MTHKQREIHRKKRVIEYADKIGNVRKACRYFGVARSTFYFWSGLPAESWALRGRLMRRIGSESEPANLATETDTDCGVFHPLGTCARAGANLAALSLEFPTFGKREIRPNELIRTLRAKFHTCGCPWKGRYRSDPLSKGE
jgi:hypothetical protein